MCSTVGYSFLSITTHMRSLQNNGCSKAFGTYRLFGSTSMRRGGFCFENNGFLSQMGFDVTILSAQVRNRFTDAYGPPFDRFIMMVKLDGHRWLCDVGFGSGLQLILSLETESSQVQSHGAYRLRSLGNFIFMEMKSETEISGIGDELYKFTLDPRERDDFTAMCDYHQSSASSIFFCKSLWSLLLPTGRITITGRRLIITSLSSVDGQQATKTTTDLSDEEITRFLREKFWNCSSFSTHSKRC